LVCISCTVDEDFVSISAWVWLVMLVVPLSVFRFVLLLSIVWVSCSFVDEFTVSLTSDRWGAVTDMIVFFLKSCIRESLKTTLTTKHVVHNTNQALCFSAIFVSNLKCWKFREYSVWGETFGSIFLRYYGLYCNFTGENHSFVVTAAQISGECSSRIQLNSRKPWIQRIHS
jgi:hypothetical protein